MKYLILFCMLAISTVAHTQILKRILDKVEDAAEEKAAEIIADQITRALNKKADEVYGDWVREAARQDSLDRVASGDTVDWEQAGSNMMDFLNGMNKAADIREVYEFDMHMVMEMESEALEENSVSDYYFNSSAPLFMFEMEDEGSTRQIILDIEKDVTLMLTTDSKGKKVGQALPNMSGLVSSMNRHEPEADYLTIKKGKGTKKIAGYNCERYIGENRDYELEYWVTDELPLDYMDQLKTYFASYYPDKNYKDLEEINGYPMQTIMTGKKKSKDDMTMTVKEVSKKSVSIQKADYSFDGSGVEY